MFCPNCGANLSDNAAFCGKCGSQIVQGNSAISEPIASDQNTAHVNAPTEATTGNSPTVAPKQVVNMSATPPGALTTAPASAPASNVPTAARKNGSKAAVIIAVAAVAIAAIIVAAGFLTGWFGLASKGGPIYVVKSSVTHNLGLVTEQRLENVHDERGNRTGYTSELYVDGELDGSNDTKNDLDANGYVTHSETHAWSKNSDTPSKTTSRTTSIELDNNGRIAKSKSVDDETGETISEQSMAYHENGQLKRRTTEGAGTRAVAKYDENGYIESFTEDYNDEMTEMIGVKSMSHDFEWEFDSSGHPESYTLVFKRVNVDSKGKETTVSDTRTYDVDTDEAGNITAIYLEGKLVGEYEYERIDNPSTAARSYFTRSNSIVSDMK